ncbi:hypothetical protein FANTH_3677 [Fusarium anthophilum]|uniref:Uncharacterized protein n=1 Tax=Fusarium anthophilum TaxID=48485 RepID=A0A8H5E911_9HYPO|nr:hypothetical protein FANTH_3677 [Fusarium anthophilum]
MSALILLRDDSKAGPCKPRSRTTDTLTTIETTSIYAKAISTEAGLSMTDVSSIGYLTFTTGQSKSTSETSTLSEDTTTSALVISIVVTSSRIDLTSSLIESSVEQTTVKENATITVLSATLASVLSSTTIERHEQGAKFSEDTTASTVLTTETSSTKELTSECILESTTTEGSYTTAIPANLVTELGSTIVDSNTGIATFAQGATATAIENSSVVEIRSVAYDETI